MANYVYALTIPVPSYNRDEVFEQQILFDSQPSRNDVLKTVSSFFSPEYPESAETVKDLNDSIEQVISEDWLRLSPSQVSTNTHVNVKLNNGVVRISPLSLERLEIIILKREK